MNDTEEMKKRIEAISAAFTILVTELQKHWLPCRSVSIAQTKIEEAHMWLMSMPNDPTIVKPKSNIQQVRVATPELVRGMPPELTK